MVLRGVCAPIDELPPTAGDGIELFHPKKKLGAPHLALNVKFGECIVTSLHRGLVVMTLVNVTRGGALSWKQVT